MAQDIAERECVDCHEKYKPTSNVQKRCPKCMVKPSRSKIVVTHAAKQPTRSAQPDLCIDGLALRVLVVAGIITAEKIEAARKIAADISKLI